jgi:hypothetical protein
MVKVCLAGSIAGDAKDDKDTNVQLMVVTYNPLEMYQLYHYYNDIPIWDDDIIMNDMCRFRSKGEVHIPSTKWVWIIISY